MPCRSDEEQPVVVIDTREQRPYEFDAQRVNVVRACLPAGDYSLVGYETRVALERKTLDDLVLTLIHDRDRFKRELEKLRRYEAACVVVEANLRDVMESRYRSRAHPKAVVGSVIAIAVDYRIPIYFCSDRDAGQRFVLGYLLRFRKLVTEGSAALQANAPVAASSGQ